jgi:acyl-coenzyme A thioesterase PaaI-like protein
MSVPTPFTTLLDSARAHEGGLAVDVPPDWAQGRSVFGGLQAALAVRAMRAHVDPAIPLRTLQATFVAPSAGRLEARATVLRTGSSATHVEARITSDSGLSTIVIGVFGKARTSAIAVMPVQPEVARPPKPFKLPYIPGLSPAFLQHFDATYLRGSIPFSGGTDPKIVIEIDLRDDGPAGEAQAIAISDLVPPIGLLLLSRPANGGTLTWMLELLADQFPAPRGWRVDAELIAGRDGYTSQSLVVWGPDGAPLALGRQSMTVFG